MLYDRLATFAENTSVGTANANAATEVGDVIDWRGGKYTQYGDTHSQETDIGDGFPLRLYLATSGWQTENHSAAEVRIQLRSHTATAIDADGATIHVDLPVAWAANLPLPSVETSFTVPSGVLANRYLGIVVQASIALSGTNNGNLTAFIAAIPHNAKTLYKEQRNWAKGL